MDVAEVERRLQEIRTCAGDNERAQGMEDELHVDVLQSIADGTCSDPPAVARLALTSQQIKFSRWYV